MSKFKYAWQNILLIFGLIFSLSSLTFAATCNPGVWGTCNPGDTVTISSNITFEAVYTANPLVWSDQTYEFNYSGSNQTQTLTAPTNGTGNTSYSKVSGDSVLTVNSTGTVTIAGGTKAGQYSIVVRASDTVSGVTKDQTFTFYIYPTLSATSIDVMYGDEEVWIYMNGLNTNSTATSTSGTLARMGDNAGFIIALNNKFTSNTSVTFNVPVGNRSKNYTVNLNKKTVNLFIHSNEVIFNNAMQTPSFYVNQIENNADYENQADLFTWELTCPSGVTNCAISADKTQAKNVVVNNLSVGKYNLKVTTKSTAEKPFKIMDGSNQVDSKTITFTINPFTLRNVAETTTIPKPNGSTETITIPANTTITYPNQTHRNIGLPVVKTTINGSKITLVKDKDYTVKYKQGNVYYSTPYNIGTYTLVINGVNNYTGEITQNFNVVAKSITELTIDAIKDYRWTGSQIKPAVDIKYGDYTLIEGTDYTLSYANNINVGTATVTITGKGNYTGTKNITFKIIENTIRYDVTNGRFVYDGNASNGGAKVTVNDPSTGATVTYYNAASGQWQSSVPTFSSVGTHVVKFRISANGYTDIQVDDKLTVNVVLSENKLKLYSNAAKTAETSSGNIIFGNGSTTIYYKSTYPGTVTAVTEPTGIADVSISGDKITITPVNAGECNIKFKIAATSNTAEGQAEYYYVVKLGSTSSTATNKTYTYDYVAHAPVVTVTPSGSTVKYTWDGQATNVTSPSTNTMPTFKDVGSYTIAYEVSKNNYNSSFGSVQLKITPRNITGSSFRASLSGTTFDYAGKNIEPVVTLKDNKNDISATGEYTLVKDKDYIVDYKDNLMPGTAKAIITGIGNYTGKIEIPFTIRPINMSVVVTNGVGDYTGYPQIGQDKEPTTEYRKANVQVNASSPYDLQFSTSLPVCSTHNVNCTVDEKIYDSGYNMPKFTDVGVHTFWYRVKAQGHQTVTGTMTITIKKAKLEKPVLFNNLIYTGRVQTPIFRNYNSKFMEMKGVVKATEAGTYTTTFKLTDDNVEWVDGTRTDWNVKWSIERIDIKTHEDIVNVLIKYNEYKQLTVEDGKVSFDRVGYNQTGWVEDCTDDLVQGQDIYDRNCSYTKFTPLQNNTYTTEAACSAAGHEWYNNKCYEKRNMFDLGSTISGMFVAQKTNSCELIKGLGYVKDEYTNSASCTDNNGVWWNNQCYDTTTSLPDSTKNDSYDLYAAWSPIIYRIQYETCDAKGCGELRGNPKTIVSYEETFTVKPPKRLGYEFTGWTITGMDDTPHVIGYDTLDVEEFTTPEEWAEDTLSFKNLNSTEDMTVKFTANWVPISYAIKYDANVNNDSYTTDWGESTHSYSYKDENGNHTTATVSGRTIEHNQKYDIPFKLSKNNFVLEGYTFAGWNTRPDGKGNMVSNETVAKITNVPIYNKGTYQVFVDQLDNVVNLANLELLDAHIRHHTSPGKDPIDVLNEIIREGITLYAQWEPNKDTKFTVTYWKQNMYDIDDNGNYNTSVDAHNAVNYTKVGTETYTAVTDTNVNITPYNYNMAANSNIVNKYISMVNVNDTSANKQVVATNSNTTYKNKNQSYIKQIGQAVGNDNTFYGFTPEKTDNKTLLSPFKNVLSNVARVNNLNTWKQKDLNDGSYPTDQYTYIVLPDGSRNIDIYYRRNIYKIFYEENGGTENNVEVRLYQEASIFSDSQDGALKCGNNNGQPNGAVNCARDSGNNSSNSGYGNFLGWFRTSNLATDQKVIGINGAATTNETIYAKWLQYRYTVSNTGWTTWGRSE